MGNLCVIVECRIEVRVSVKCGIWVVSVSLLSVVIVIYTVYTRYELNII